MDDYFIRDLERTAAILEVVLRLTAQQRNYSVAYWAPVWRGLSYGRIAFAGTASGTHRTETFSGRFQGWVQVDRAPEGLDRFLRV